MALLCALSIAGCGRRAPADAPRSSEAQATAPAVPSAVPLGEAVTAATVAAGAIVLGSAAAGSSADGAAAAGAEAAAAEAEKRAAAAEIASYAERRKRPRAVIGGCEESCERPESALSALIDGLTRATPELRVEALWGRVDYSQLVVDGEPRGEAWSALWQDVRHHRQREDEIRLFLLDMAALREQVANPSSLPSSLRGAGTVLRPLPGRADLFEAQLRLPALRPEVRGEGSWRLVLVRRGWEWLLTELERAPSRRPLQPDRYGGSAATGRL